MAVPDNSPVERFRQDFPSALAVVGQVIVDNPKPLLLLAAGDIVMMKILVNLVRPRTPVEALALLVVGSALAGWGAEQLIDRGILNFRVRDHQGCLVSLRPDDSASAE